jgi:hypothetical protein
MDNADPPADDEKQAGAFYNKARGLAHMAAMPTIATR